MVLEEKLEVLNYVLRKKDTFEHWYNVFENYVKKKVMEEIGLKIENIDCVASLIYIKVIKSHY